MIIILAIGLALVYGYIVLEFTDQCSVAEPDWACLTMLLVAGVACAGALGMVLEKLL